MTEDFDWCGSLATGALSKSAHSDEESFRIVTAKGNKGYEAVSQRDVLNLDLLPRGAMADGPLEHLALPDPGFEPLLVTDVSEEVKSMYTDFRAEMLKPTRDVPWEAMEKIKPYWSPTYRTLRSKLELALRLFLCGMLGFTHVCISTVSLFTVVKSHKPDESGKMVTWLRAVWDERGPNMLWRDRPWVSLGSPTSFCQIDLSALPEGWGIGSAVGDIPNYFYALRNPPFLYPFFVFPEISAEMFKAFAAERGIPVTIPDGCIYCCVVSVLMGWSWAPYVAQTALAALMDHVFKPGVQAARLIHRIVVPRIGTAEECAREAGSIPRRPKKEGQDTAAWMIDVLYLTDLMVKFLTYVFIDDYGVLQLIPLDSQ